MYGLIFAETNGGNTSLQLVSLHYLNGTLQNSVYCLLQKIRYIADSSCADLRIVTIL